MNQIDKQGELLIITDVILNKLFILPPWVFSHILPSVYMSFISGLFYFWQTPHLICLFFQFWMQEKCSEVWKSYFCLLQ